MLAPWPGDSTRIGELPESVGAHLGALWLPIRVQIRNPGWNVDGAWIRVLPAGLWNVGRGEESLRLDVSELVVDRAPEVNRLLTEGDARATVGEVPLEYRKADA